MDEDAQKLLELLQPYQLRDPNPKAQRYVGKFYERKRRGLTIMGMVKGNHGHYKVSLEAQGDNTKGACSCYIGKRGGCHHVRALAQTFLAEPESFVAIPTAKNAPTTAELAHLHAYLQGVTLEELLLQMKSKGVTYKAFCEAIGMSTQKLSAVKSSELRHHYFHELGAIKLAVLWMLERLEKNEPRL